MARHDQRRTLTWAMVGNTAGFGDTSHDPTWIGSFSGPGQDEVLFYSPGDHNGGSAWTCGEACTGHWLGRALRPVPSTAGCDVEYRAG